MQLTLTRDPAQPAMYCTLGILECAGRKFHTIERPWVPDLRGPCGVPEVSCIPKASYRMEARKTEARGKHWILVNTSVLIFRDRVPDLQFGRCLCLIHIANWAHELHGCVAIGKGRAKDFKGEWMVTESSNAMNELRTLIGTSFDLQLVIL